MADFPSNISFENRNVLVTGANCGLGYYSALHALELHASILVLVVRSLEKGEDTKKRLLEEPSIKALDPKPDIRIYALDLSSYDSVTSFVAKLTSDLPRLDNAVLNAGAFNYNVRVADEGYAEELKVNYISNVLLATLLLPMLERSASNAPSHLTFVASQASLYHGFEKDGVPADVPIFTHLKNPSRFGSFRRYSQSKFCLVSWIRRAAPKIDRSKVIMNCMCPGPVDTNLARGLPWYIHPFIKLVQILFFIPGEVAAWKVMYAVSPAAGEKSHGELLAYNKIMPTSKLPFLGTEKGLEFGKKLWEETSEKIEALSPGAYEKANL